VASNGTENTAAGERVNQTCQAGLEGGVGRVWEEEKDVAGEGGLPVQRVTDSG